MPSRKTASALKTIAGPWEERHFVDGGQKAEPEEFRTCPYCKGSGRVAVKPRQEGPLARPATEEQLYEYQQDAALQLSLFIDNARPGGRKGDKVKNAREAAEDLVEIARRDPLVAWIFAHVAQESPYNGPRGNSP